MTDFLYPRTWLSDLGNCMAPMKFWLNRPGYPMLDWEALMELLFGHIESTDILPFPTETTQMQEGDEFGEETTNIALLPGQADVGQWEEFAEEVVNQGWLYETMYFRPFDRILLTAALRHTGLRLQDYLLHHGLYEEGHFCYLYMGMIGHDLYQFALRRPFPQTEVRHFGSEFSCRPTA